MDTNVFAHVVLDPNRGHATRTVRRLDVVQKEYHHDIAEVVVRGETDNAEEFKTGTPVQIDYGRFPRDEGTFYGYINHTVPEVDRTHPQVGSRDMKLVCIGASYTMKQPLTGVFTDRTAQGVVLDIAGQFLFTADIPFSNTDIVFPSLNCPGLSAWKFCAETAKKAGLVFYCNKTEIRMMDPLEELHRLDRFVPTFYHRDYFPGIDTIISFKTESGDYFPEPGRQRVTRLAYGVNPRTGEMIFATNDGSSGPITLARTAPKPRFAKYETALVVGDNFLANQRLDAAAKLNRFHVKAVAEVNGDPRIHQGSVVVLEGLNDKHSGLWYVHEATHAISAQRFSTKLVLGRDSEYDDGTRPGPPVNVVSPRYDPYNQQVVVETPPTILVGDTWRSAWLAKRPVPNA